MFATGLRPRQEGSPLVIILQPAIDAEKPCACRAAAALASTAGEGGWSKAKNQAWPRRANLALDLLDCSLQLLTRCRALVEKIELGGSGRQSRLFSASSATWCCGRPQA